MHEHCEHDLKHCGKCDVAYCATCSKEWGAHSTYTPMEYTTTTVDTGTTDLIYMTPCSHTV